MNDIVCLVCGAVTTIGRVRRLADDGTASMSSDIEVSCDISGSKLCPLNKQPWTNSGRVVTLQAASGVAGSTI